MARPFAGPESVARGQIARGASPVRATAPVQKTILIVDDDRWTRDLIAKLLSEDGYRIDVSATSDDLDVALGRQSVSLVLLAVGAAYDRDLSLCGRLANGSRVQVIALLRTADDDAHIAALNAGADDVIVKPCNPRELLARVHAVLRRPRAP